MTAIASFLPCFPCTGRETGTPARAALKQDAYKERGNNSLRWSALFWEAERVLLPIVCLRFTLTSLVFVLAYQQQVVLQNWCAAWLCQSCDIVVTCVGQDARPCSPAAAGVGTGHFAISPFPGHHHLHRSLLRLTAVQRPLHKTCQGVNEFLWVSMELATNYGQPNRKTKGHAEVLERWACICMCLQGFHPGMGRTWPSSHCCCGLAVTNSKTEKYMPIN